MSIGSQFPYLFFLACIWNYISSFYFGFFSLVPIPCTIPDFRYHTRFLIARNFVFMNKLKMALFVGVLVSLFACTTTHQPKKTVKSRFLKNNISQAELNNSVNYKPYHYRCNNKDTGGISHLTTYFPLSRESRMKDNFGFYFQLDNGKAVPFDHSYTLTLNARGTKFEVVYRSYDPIQGSYVDLIARSQSSIYYKNQQGKQVPWLICKGG